MSKTVVGMVTFGNVEFSKLTIKSIKETTESDLDFFVVVGKPNDPETIAWLNEDHIAYTEHETNIGFPAGLNDIYDYAWVDHAYDNLIICGNDIVAYPYAIDSLIHKADNSDWEWISSSQFDVRALCDMYPQAKDMFSKEGKFRFSKFGEAEPWNLHDHWKDQSDRVEPDVIKDVHNLCLYKPSVMDKIGYIDVNFYPAYYSDNDYARRGVNAGLKTCALANSQYFHFWSRTIHQGSGGSTGRYFDNNRRFYISKWGGDFAHEAWTTPFNGVPYPLTKNVLLPASLKIDDRSQEEIITRFWRGGR
jgi:GT2 family glycosyltransferase